jgi:hypothetical protein
MTGALPDLPHGYGAPADALLAFPTNGQVVCRVLKGAQPAKSDFRSDEMAGRPRGRNEAWIEHAGVSVYDDPQTALAIVRRFPVYVAEVQLMPDLGCSIARTGPPRHFTVWGDPGVLLVSVYRQTRANGALERRA